MKTAMKDLTKIYIDLSKCSKKERKHIFSLLPEPLELDDYYIVDDYMFLTTRYSDDNYWIVVSEDDTALYNKTELTYPEFIKLFEGGEEEKKLSFETEYQLEEFRKIESEYFDENGKCYNGIHLSTNIMEKMLSLINQLETELNSNQ